MLHLLGPAWSLWLLRAQARTTVDCRFVEQRIAVDCGFVEQHSQVCLKTESWHTARYVGTLVITEGHTGTGTCTHITASVADPDNCPGVL